MDTTMDFARGDAANHTFSIPTANWKPAGHLYFAAKVGFDDDANDSAAIIKGDWGDEAVTDTVKVIKGVSTPCKTYACHFPASATKSALSNGASSQDLLGEFEWVPATGDPITFPATDEAKIPVKLYFDITIKVTA